MYSTRSMPRPPILDRLNQGQSLLLDGGTGSELQRRGVDVLVGAKDGLKAWSATANLKFADVVQQVHQDYLRVGADIITSNNFWTAPTRLERCGLGGEWRSYARAAAENALKARDKLNPEAYVAGGIAAATLQGPPESSPVSDTRQMGREACFREWAEHAKLLVEAGVDLIQAEYVGFIEDCVTAVDACSEAGATVFLGVRHIRPDGAMQYGERLEDLAKALEGRPVGAILLMCSDPEAISAGLPRLRQAFSGPVGAYPNLGYNPTGPILNLPVLSNQKASTGPDILQNAAYYPSRIAEFARIWKRMGARIIGGCCASGPEHISAMRPVVKGNGAA